MIASLVTSGLLGFGLATGGLIPGAAAVFVYIPTDPYATTEIVDAGALAPDPYSTIEISARV